MNVLVVYSDPINFFFSILLSVPLRLVCLTKSLYLSFYEFLLVLMEELVTDLHPNYLSFLQVLSLGLDFAILLY